MAFIQTKTEIEYPESDGQPMGESDWHIDWTIRLRELLKWRYRDQQVYVASDLIVYYHEGDPRKSIVPDGMVVLNHSPKNRRTYKIWDEDNRVPDVVFEFTSLSSKVNDTIAKPKVYAALGVREYFIYDPEREYLQPPLQGFRLESDEYVAIEPDASHAIHCQTLGLSLRMEDNQLLIADLTTGDPLLTEAEAETERADAEAELKARAEAEILQLRAELKRRRDEM